MELTPEPNVAESLDKAILRNPSTHKYHSGTLQALQVRVSLHPVYNLLISKETISVSSCSELSLIRNIRFNLQPLLKSEGPEI